MTCESCAFWVKGMAVRDPVLFARYCRNTSSPHKWTITSHTETCSSHRAAPTPSTPALPPHGTH